MNLLETLENQINILTQTLTSYSEINVKLNSTVVVLRDAFKSMLEDIKVKEKVLTEKQDGINATKEDIESKYNKALKLVADCENILAVAREAKLNFAELANAQVKRDETLQSYESELSDRESKLVEKESQLKTAHSEFLKQQEAWNTEKEEQASKLNVEAKRLEGIADTLVLREKGLELRENTLKDAEQERNDEQRLKRDREKLLKA